MSFSGGGSLEPEGKLMYRRLPWRREGMNSVYSPRKVRFALKGVFPAPSNLDFLP